MKADAIDFAIHHADRAAAGQAKTPDTAEATLFDLGHLQANRAAAEQHKAIPAIPGATISDLPVADRVEVSAKPFGKQGRTDQVAFILPGMASFEHMRLPKEATRVFAQLLEVVARNPRSFTTVRPIEGQRYRAVSEGASPHFPGQGRIIVTDDRPWSRGLRHQFHVPLVYAEAVAGAINKACSGVASKRRKIDPALQA